ncbi:cytochrome P450 71A9 [Lolium perenne]|uniref:cytochrome P450 71A9 n=1 Tax=Lolium perenne TaxID=4522 RepID=UPI0021EADC90|nr:cytochrome P450 71A9-like [Lolium perenne]
MASFQAHELFAWLLVVVATLLVLKQLLAPAKKRAASPSLPRPRGLPLIGNLHQLGALPQNSLAAPLMLLRLGSVPTLVVSSPDAARALFQHNDRALSGRPALYAASRFSYGLQNISFAPTEGTFWRAARRACLSELLGAPRVRGFRNAREGAAAALVAAVTDASGAGAPVDLSKLLIATSNRIVTRVAFGGRDDGGLETSAVLKETQSLLGAFWVADYVPWLGWLDALRGLRGRLERNFHQLDAFYERVIDSHLNKRTSASTDEEEEEEDLVDVLLRLHADPAQGGTFGSRDQIKGILTDMFIAGTDTSAATVEWTMTELVNHPDVLAKAQHEVRSVVGDGSDMVREPDLRGLEYLKLVIKESMRLHPPVPLLVPRETIEPCTVQGCEVPAGTRVLVNAKAIGAHPGAWGPDAALFVPERHSEVEAGKDFRPWVDDSFALVPFGIGRRSCPGVHFATAVVELVLANLLFSFDWSAPLGEAVDTEEVNGLTVYRKNPLLLLAKRRYVPASK